MLLLDSLLEAGGLQLFRDHAAPQLFHYLPGSPRVPAGGAGIQLLRYRGGEQGGLLTLEAELHPSVDALQAARTALAARFGAAAELVPVLFQEGTVRLSALGVDSAAAAAPSPLVERVLGTATPSLLGGGRASFSLVLEPEGATLAAAALTAGQSFLVLSYELVFSGLRPARGLRAQVSYHMAYDYLRTRLQANALWARADLDRETEALQRQGLIRIEDVDYTGALIDGATLERRRAEVLATLRELSETIFFRPAASPWTLGAQGLAQAPAALAAWERQGRPQAAFLLRALRQDEQQELTYALNEAQVAARRIAPQGALRLPEGARPEDHVRDVTLEASGPVQVRVFCSPGTAWGGVKQVVVDLRSGTEVRSLVLDPSRSEQTALLPAGSTAIEHRIRLATGDGTGAGTEPPWHPLPLLDLAIDPVALTGQRTVDVLLGVVDPQVVQKVQVRLLPAGAPARELMLDAAHPAERVQVAAGTALPLEALFYLPEQQSAALSQLVPPGQTVAVLNQPPGLFQVLLVLLQDPLDRFDAILVELERAAGDPRRQVRLDRGTPSASWSAPVKAGEPRTFRYRVRRVGKDAQVYQDEWQTGSGGLLVVGDTELRLDTIEGVLLGPADQHLGALLHFTSLAPAPDIPAQMELMLDPGQLEFRVRLPFQRQAPRRYRVQAQVFLADRTLQRDLAEESGEVLLLSFA